METERVFENCVKCSEPKSDGPDCLNCGVIYAKAEAKHREDLGKIRIAREELFSEPHCENPVRQYTSSARINKQLAALGEFSIFFTKKEIKYLPNVLREDENVKALSSGLVDGNTWLIVVSDQRLLFLDKGMLYGLKQMEMNYEKVSAVSHSMGLLLASLIVSTSGGIKKIDSIPKNDAPKISNLISDLIRNTHKKDLPTTQNNNMDITSQLERLASLLERGLLTEEEFKTQKEKLLK